MEETAGQQTLFTQQNVKYKVTFILVTVERIWKKDSANIGTIPKTDQVTVNSQRTHKCQHAFGKDIEVLTLKGNLHQKYERELWEDKFICLLSPTGLNTGLKYCGRKLYKAFANLVEWNKEL